MVRWMTLSVVIGLCVACGGESSSDGSGGAGGATGGSAGTAGSSGGTTGGSGGAMGGSGGASGGAAGASGGAAGASGGAGGSGGIDCNPATVTCKASVPDCAKGEVPSVQNGCWGPCVPILNCATEKDCSGCTNGWCAEYQSWTTEYRCVMPSVQCSALACSCLGDYFCVGPWNACSIPSTGPAKVACSCPAC